MWVPLLLDRAREYWRAPAWAARGRYLGTGPSRPQISHRAGLFSSLTRRRYCRFLPRSYSVPTSLPACPCSVHPATASTARNNPESPLRPFASARSTLTAHSAISPHRPSSPSHSPPLPHLSPQTLTTASQL